MRPAFAVVCAAAAAAACVSCQSHDKEQSSAQQAPSEGAAQVVRALEWHEIQGDGWTMDVPVSWRRERPGHFRAADGANVLVRVRRNPIPLSLLTDANLKDIQDNHPSYVLGDNLQGRVGRWPAQELTGRLTTARGTPVVQRMVILDLGPSKVTLTASAHASDFLGLAPIFDRIIHSFKPASELLQGKPDAPIQGQ